MNTLKIFEGTRVCWLGINNEEIIHMNEILTTNGGIVTTLDDPNCTHVVSKVKWEKQAKITFIKFNDANFQLIGNRFFRNKYRSGRHSQQSCSGRS